MFNLSSLSFLDYSKHNSRENDKREDEKDKSKIKNKNMMKKNSKFFFVN